MGVIMGATLKELTQAYMLNEIYNYDCIVAQRIRNMSAGERFDLMGEEEMLHIMKDIVWKNWAKKQRDMLLDSWCYDNFNLDYDGLMSWIGEENDG
jgi:hypothetical protein